MLGKTQVQQDKYGSVIKHTHSQFHAHRCYVWFYSPSVENSFVQGRFIWLDEAFSQEKETTIANMVLSKVFIKRILSNGMILSNNMILSNDWVLHPMTGFYPSKGDHPTT